ncbi:MAG: hypothetical protein LAT55_12630 [Opitutales bacterium]|nr:hypothetical protein [Opitutales bacterium]
MNNQKPKERTWLRRNIDFLQVMGGFAAIICIIITNAAAWITHVAYSIIHEAWVLLVVGAFIVPIGIIHGIMIWLGFG